MREASESGPALRRLSEQLGLCAFGLSLVRRGWETLARENSRRFRRRWRP